MIIKIVQITRMPLRQDRFFVSALTLVDRRACAFLFAEKQCRKSAIVCFEMGRLFVGFSLDHNRLKNCQIDWIIAKKFPIDFQSTRIFR